MAKLITKVQLTDHKAKVPTQAHDTDTGYDLTLTGVKKVEGDVIFFKTGVQVQPPKGYYFEIVPRSCMSELPLAMANSVAIIDESYRGELIIALRVMHSNMGNATKNTTFPGGLVSILDSRPQSLASLAEVVLARKPKLCQLILRKRHSCEFKVVQELEETERGEGGFGSTDEDVTPAE